MNRWMALATVACFAWTFCGAARGQFCTQLIQGTAPGDDPTVADFSCDRQQCDSCLHPEPGFDNVYGPYEVIAATDLDTDNPVSTLTVLPISDGECIPIDSSGACCPADPESCERERVVAVYFVWDWPIEYSGPEDQITLDLSVTMPGDQAWLDYQFLPGYDLPVCVTFGTQGVDYARVDPESPWLVDGCAPLPGSAEPALGIGWRAFMPRMGRQDAPWLSLLAQLNSGDPAAPSDPGDLIIKAAGLPSGAVVKSGTVPAQIYFFTRFSQMWGDIIPTAPAAEFEQVSGSEVGLIYLNNNDDSGTPGVTDKDEPSEPSGDNMFLHFENTIPGPLATHVMMIQGMPELICEFPYIEQIDRQLTPIVLDLPPNWTSRLANGGARLRQVPDCATSLDCGSDSECSPARMWLVEDMDADGQYDTVHRREFDANTPLVFDFPTQIMEFCKMVGRPFMDDNSCATPGFDCATPGFGWGHPNGLMLEAVGGLEEQISLRLETSTDYDCPSVGPCTGSWEARDCVTFDTMGFGFLINGSTGPFETPSLGGYEIPTLAPGVAELPPEPPYLEERLVPVRIEAPEAFLRLNTNPIAGFHLAPGHQWVVRRVPKNAGDPPPKPTYVSLASFPDCTCNPYPDCTDDQNEPCDWPGFLAGEGDPSIGLTPRRAYFQLTVQDGMPLGSWTSLVNNLFIAHWPDDPRLLDGRSCAAGALPATQGAPSGQCNCSTGASVATGMCGAAMGNTCAGDCGPCAKSNKNSCEPKEPPCPKSTGTPQSGGSADQCEDKTKCSKSTTDDPVYMFSGEFFQEDVDLRIPGRGHDFVWKRKYRSKVGPNTSQGNGWDCAYNIFLEQTGQNLSNLVLFDGNTRSDIYYTQGDGTWIADGFVRVIEFNNISESCSGDLTGDNVVGALDLMAVILDWDCTDSCVADLSGDNAVNVIDLFLVLSNWGACPETPAYEVTFADQSRWTLFPFDGSPSAGKLKSQIDRFGNSISLQYDDAGRVTTIVDTLDRPIEIAYNADGFIAAVTDFIGRQVQYEYYQDGEDIDGDEVADGSFGDLKSVRTPIVIGTPNENDFPDGKTTFYTYSAGFADERLNHNLLTITDPKGQHYLTNVYTDSQNPDDFCFDRVARQFWGDQDTETGDIIDLVYVPFDEVDENNAVSQTIVNDRNGNVLVTFFDRNNREVLRREYTGRWDADTPTLLEDLGDPQIQKLRASDPDFFETKREYNQDSLITRMVHPNGNETINVYDEENPSRRSQSNLIQRIRLPGPLDGDQSQIVEFFEFDAEFGGCCGFNFVTRHVDGRGHESLYEYDEHGNRTRAQERIPSVVHDYEYNRFGQMTAHVLPDNGSAHRRRDEYTHYPLGPQRGYREKEIVDAAGFALATAYEYDLVGNVIRKTDPSGHDMQYTVNELNQVVHRASREVTPGGVRYHRDTFYDANDNVVRVDVQNVDETGVEQPNAHFTSIYEYEILNYQTRMCQESGSHVVQRGASPQLDCAGLPESEFITTEFAYDAKRNRTLMRYGEAVENRQQHNAVRTLYDERDLAYRVTRGTEDLDPTRVTPDQSTTQYDYDHNRNLRAVRQGIEDQPRVATTVYDGYNRRVSATDPMGNRTIYRYDQNSNVASARREGELIDVQLSSGNIRLAETAYVYDFMDRRTRSEERFFDTETQLPIGDGLSVTQTFWSDNSQVIRSVNDNDHETVVAYDTANRRSVTTDAKANTRVYVYDDDDNVVAITTVEKSDLAGNSDELFTTTYAYDGLDRRVSMTDNVGNTGTYLYDSRNNRVRTVDALGNVVRYVYDGINRLTETIREMRDTGDWTGTLVGTITTTQVWDDTNRLTGQADDNGNLTTYVFDALNRKTGEIYADDTRHIYTLDIHDNKIQMIDPNGSVVSCQYDLLNRQKRKGIVPAVGVSDDTTFEVFKYDGLSRLIHAEDNDSLVTRSYNSRSNTTRETLNGQTTESVYDTLSNMTQCTYPGGRIINCTFDELERKKIISDTVTGVVASYDYVGPSRVTRREYGNGTRTDYAHNGITGVANPVGDFAVKKIIGTKHTRITDGSVIDDRTYTWDKLHNKTRRKDIRADGPQLTHDYSYDSVYRLIHTNVTDGDGEVVRDTVYSLDGVGNRTTVAGTPDPGPYVMDPTTPDPADRQMNQYTSTSFDSREYDDNGNLVAIDGAQPAERTIVYDYRNRMVRYADDANATTATYGYDALNRRIARIVDDGTMETTRYFYTQWRVCEEQNEASAVQATYVYGLYIDEVLNMQRGGLDFFFNCDDLYSVVSVTDPASAVAERYEYGDYGELSVFVNAGAPLFASAIGNVHSFTGRRYDRETSWLYFRTRYLSGTAGRFTARDFAGLWHDSGNVGGSFAYVGNAPTVGLDPFGKKDVVQIVVDQGNSEVSFVYDDGSSESWPAATGSEVDNPGSTTPANGDVTGTAWGPIGPYENTVNSWSESDPSSPYGPAIIQCKGTDGRHIHGTVGPLKGMDPDDLSNIGGNDPDDRQFTHGCARVTNPNMVKLKNAVDKSLKKGNKIKCIFK